MKKLAFILLMISANLAIFAQIRPSFSQSKDNNTGLFTNGNKTILVRIEELPKYAADIDIEQKRIATKIELRIRQAGLNPVTIFQPVSFNQDKWKLADNGYLYIVFDIGYYEAMRVYIFLFRIEYNRPVAYTVGGVAHNNIATSWSDSRFGIVGKSRADIIMNSLDSIMDSFLNEYLKENGL